MLRDKVRTLTYRITGGLQGLGLAPPPHDLPEINKQQRVTCCVSLRSRELNFKHLFLDRIITNSDEKWW
ncbi:unnamed protein product, partial [Hymenolepis diminuta]